MAKNKQRTAYGAPAEEKEVVVTVDRRLLWGAGVVVVFGLALGIGMLSSRRGAGATPPTTASNSAPMGSVQEDINRASLLAEDAAKAMGAEVSVIGPESYMVDPNAGSAVQPAPDPGLPGSLPENADSDVPAEFQEMIDQGQGAEVPLTDISNREAVNWDVSTLATLGDPNVTDKDYSPYRVEDFETKGLEGGPRLAIGGLNSVYTYSFDRIPVDQPVQKDLEIRNIGDQDLVVSRIYSGCGCTAPRIGDMTIDSAGFLPEMLTLKPGESIDFTVEFDPRLAKETGAQAKWLQIYSNDTSKAVFDDLEPEFTHETRFRIVMQPTYGMTMEEYESQGATTP